MDSQRIILDRLYDAVASHCQCTIMRLTREDQMDLAKWQKCNSINFSAYDRTLMFLRVKRIMKQKHFLKKIPNLVFLEHDACQDKMPESPYFGRFTDLYLSLPSCRVLCSGYQLTQEFKKLGIDSVFVPKGCDTEMVVNQNQPRGIELGFIGSLKHDVYTGRRNFLLKMHELEGLDIERTESGHPYVERLNRIRIFLNADVGMREYMIKNFEAMAAGCLLMCLDMGDEENKAVGFQDGENVVLFKNLEESSFKLRELQQDHARVVAIATAGEKWVREKANYSVVSRRIVDALPSPLADWPQPTLLVKLKKWFSGK